MGGHLCGINQYECIFFMSGLDDCLQIRCSACHIAESGDGYQLHAVVRHLCVQGCRINLSLLINLDPPQFNAHTLFQLQPGDSVTVVFQH